MFLTCPSVHAYMRTGIGILQPACSRLLVCICLQCFDIVGLKGIRKSFWPVKNCGYLSGARWTLFAYGPPDATASQTPSSLASFKSRMVLPFWYRLTQILLEKSLLKEGSSGSSSSLYYMYITPQQTFYHLRLSYIIIIMFLYPKLMISTLILKSKGDCNCPSRFKDRRLGVIIRLSWLP